MKFDILNPCGLKEFSQFITFHILSNVQQYFESQSVIFSNDLHLQQNK